MERCRDALRRSLARLSAVVVFLLACETESRPTEPLAQLSMAHSSTLRFSQLNVSVSGQVHPNTAWGALDFEFDVIEEIRYVNLAVNGVWRIQNVPLLRLDLPGAGTGSVPTIRVNFDLGVPAGTVVPALSYAFVLAPTPLSQMPQGTTAALVTSANYVLSTCFAQSPILFNPPSPTMIGGQQAAVAIQRKNFPNQEAGVNECVPVAASNSLQWMDRRHRLGLNAADISIAAMKTATGWTSAGTAGQWWIKKNDYLAAKGIPITTANVSRSIDALVDAMKRGCDVELVIGNHAVAVTGVTRLANGNYTVVVTNDTDQGNPDGRVSELLTFNTATKTFQGAPWNNGLGMGQLIVECKK